MTLAETTVRPSTLRMRRLAAAALIAALTAALGPFSIALGAVPFTIQTFGVALAALLLPPGWAAASMALYVALGAIGLPVFAKGAAGLGVLAGPTGGYLLGFIVGAAVGSAVCRALRAVKVAEPIADGVAGLALLVTVYATGTTWLALSLHLSPAAAITVGVVPFILADIIKIAVAALIAAAVRAAGVRL